MLRNNMLVKIFLIILFSCSLVRCSCFSLGFGSSSGDHDDWDDDGAGAGEYVNQAGSSYAFHDLYLDAIYLETDFYRYDATYDDAEIEIHVMDESEESMLACVGENNHPVLEYLRNDIQYGQINAQFYKQADATLDSDTMVTIHLVEKGKYQPACPENLNTGTSKSSTDDITIDTLTLAYKDIFEGPIVFADYATVYFKTEEMTEQVFEVSEDLDDGFLTVNQLYLENKEINDDEYSRPEVGVFLAPYGSYEMTACVEFEYVESGGVLFGDLNEYLLNEDGQYVSLEDLDPEESYWFILVEMDDKRCPDPDVFLDSDEYNLLGTTQSIIFEDMTTTQIEFANGYGYLNLIVN